MIPYSWFEEAAQRIAPHVHKTPLTFDEEHRIFLKWENHQITGSFKARGAVNKILSLQDWERQRGLVAASAGNHGQGVALAGGYVGAPVTIFASDHAVRAKVEAMRAMGATVNLVPGGYGEAEQAGLSYAAEHEASWISPYNDGQVIAGQGTLALEIMAELPPGLPVTWVVPVGGGGLISGIAAAIKLSPGLTAGHRVIGVQSVASPFFHAIFNQGDQEGVIELPSLADGLAGPVEEHSLTIPLVRRYVDEILLVSEEQVLQAIVFAWQNYHERIEGSAAAALAALTSGKIVDRPAVVIISGGNIQPELFAEIIHLEK